MFSRNKSSGRCASRNSTSRDNLNFDQFSNSPNQSSNYYSEPSPFNSTRDNFFHRFDESRNHFTPNKMFVDESPFVSSFYQPQMMSGFPNSDMASHSRREDVDEEFHHPRVFNIPIQVETPQGFVPLVRSNSNPGHGPFRSRANSNHEQSSEPTSINVPNQSPEKFGATLKQRPVKSPTPPPKPKFSRHQPEAEMHHLADTFCNPHQSRVHTIPVKIQRSSKFQDTDQLGADSLTGNDNRNHFSSKQTDSVEGKRSRSSSESDSHQPGIPRPINIPINIEKSHPPKESNSSKNETVTPVSEPKPESIKNKPTDPIDLIKSIEQEACQLEKEVIDFNGEYLDKRYRYLDEMLTRCMLKLDQIESNGRENVRTARRSALAHVDHCIAILESKVNKSTPNENEMKEGDDKETEIANLVEAEPVNETQTVLDNSSDNLDQQNNDEIEIENKDEEPHAKAVDDLKEPDSFPVNTDEPNQLESKSDSSNNELEGNEESSVNVDLDTLSNTCQGEQTELMSTDLDPSQTGQSLEPKIEFPSDDHSDGLVTKESMDVEVGSLADNTEINNGTNHPVEEEPIVSNISVGNTDVNSQSEQSENEKMEDSTSFSIKTADESNRD